MFGKLKTMLGMHRWHYSNPFDRTCGTCGRHEVQHSWGAHWRDGWWEVFDEGYLAACNRHQAEEDPDA